MKDRDKLFNNYILDSIKDKDTYQRTLNDICQFWVRRNFYMGKMFEIEINDALCMLISRIRAAFHRLRRIAIISKFVFVFCLNQKLQRKSLNAFFRFVYTFCKKLFER